MAKRESFLIRIDPKLLAALKVWAEAELRSTNSHLEYLLRDCLIRSGRLPKGESENSPKDGDAP